MNLLSVDAARARILEGLRPLPSERVAVAEALGRALVAPVVAVRTLPPWNNSAMDGYAVRAAEAIAGATLRVGETVRAGHRATRPIASGEAARIMTGAPLPDGADAVVMQERVTRQSDGTVRIDEGPKPGQNVRLAGEDATAGAPLLAAGTALGVPELGRLWSQGLTQVDVPRRPTVAIASSGDELVPVGTTSGERLVDTNSPMLAELVRRAGGVPTMLGIAPDGLEPMRRHFEPGLAFDVLLTSAGVSVGDHDFTKEALEGAGVTMDFWRIAMRPGKPLAFGRKGQTLVLGLPGNPVSALVTFELYVRPALLALQGHREVLPRARPAKLAAPLKPVPGLHLFARATAAYRDGGWWATPLPSQTSGVLASAAEAQVLISVPPETERLQVGQTIDVLEVSWAARTC